MRSFEYLADGHHVDDAGNLICCSYVDFRDPVDQSPVTTLTKASSKRHAIPGCGTIRISKPSCFLGRGEGLVGHGEQAWESQLGEPVEEGVVRNGWIFSASIEPGTDEERSACRQAMPSGHGTLSPIRRPRAFARALAAMAAEQAGPRGQTVLLRSTVDDQVFCTAHRSQTVYHGPVVYADDPVRRLERASSDLELLLLLVFLKHAAHRAQREYRFAVWTEEAPAEDRVDLRISPALRDAMQRPRQQPEASGLVSARMEACSAAAALAAGSLAGSGEHVESVPALAGTGNVAVAARRYEVERRRPDQREATTAYAGVAALRGAVARFDGAGRKDAAAAAWHAEPIVRFLCSTFGDGIVGVRVSDDLIVITATLPGDDPVEASVAVEPEGSCACRISAGDTHLAATAPDPRSFEPVLKDRLAQVGCRVRTPPCEPAAREELI